MLRDLGETQNMGDVRRRCHDRQQGKTSSRRWESLTMSDHSPCHSLEKILHNKFDPSQFSKTFLHNDIRTMWSSAISSKTVGNKKLCDRRSWTNWGNAKPSDQIYHLDIHIYIYIYYINSSFDLRQGSVWGQVHLGGARRCDN